MIKSRNSFRKIHKLAISTTLTLGAFFSPQLSNNTIHASPGMFEIQWDPDPSFVRLKLLQTSNEKQDRAKYHFFLRSGERKTGILQLTLKVPNYFDAKISEKKLSLCQVKIGGFKDRTKCIKELPAVFEISKDQSSIDIYPDNPIPMDKNTYAVILKLFNPRKSGMFQFHGYAKSTGAMPISSYIGSWTVDIK